MVRYDDVIFDPSPRPSPENPLAAASKVQSNTSPFTTLDGVTSAAGGANNVVAAGSGNKKPPSWEVVSVYLPGWVVADLRDLFFEFLFFSSPFGEKPITNEYRGTPRVSLSHSVERDQFAPLISVVPGLWTLINGTDRARNDRSTRRRLSTCHGIYSVVQPTFSLNPDRT